MDDNIVMLLVKAGLFFANCDGVYDETERKFIENFLSELDNNGYSVSGETRELAVKALDSSYSFSDIVSETKAYLQEFNEVEKHAILDSFSEFIGKVIKADSVVSEQEQQFFSQWKKEFNM